MFATCQQTGAMPEIEETAQAANDCQKGATQDQVAGHAVPSKEEQKSASTAAEMVDPGKLADPDMAESGRRSVDTARGGVQKQWRLVIVHTRAAESAPEETETADQNQEREVHYTVADMEGIEEGWPEVWDEQSCRESTENDLLQFVLAIFAPDPHQQASLNHCRFHLPDQLPL